MTEIRFYHLTRRPLESALPEILSKAYAKGSLVVVRTPSAQETEKLNETLWTYNPNVFLPHGSKADGNSDMQPVWLTEGDDNPNNADTLLITGTASDAGYEAYALCCLMFDGHDEQALQISRTRWKAYKDAGQDPAYWQQTDKGWEKK